MNRIFILLLYFKFSWPNLEYSNCLLFLSISALKSINSLSSIICYNYLLRLLISNPAMPTINLFRPLPLTFLSLGFNWYFNYTIPYDYYKLILNVMKISWFKSYEDRNLHPWSNISWIFNWILNIWYNKLFFLQRCYFNSLKVLRSINQF